MPNSRPRVLVIGMGALGRIFVWALAGRLDVRGAARNEARANRLGQGFAVRWGERDQEVRIPCHPQTADAWRADVGILLTKARDTATAVASVAPLLDAGAPVVTLQNGLGNRESISRELGPMRAVLGVTYVAGTALDGTTSELVNPGETVFGLSPGDNGALEDLAAALTAGGLPARVGADAEIRAWFKVVQAGAMNVTGALSGLQVGAYWADPEWQRFLRAMVEEGAAVATAEGVRVDPADVISGVAAIAERAPLTTPSMLQDVRRRTPTEIEALSGELARRGEARGLAVPTLREAADRVRQLEAAWR